jgi:hypothetical protein
VKTVVLSGARAIGLSSASPSCYQAHRLARIPLLARVWHRANGSNIKKLTNCWGRRYRWITGKRHAQTAGRKPGFNTLNPCRAGGNITAKERGWQENIP